MIKTKMIKAKMFLVVALDKQNKLISSMPYTTLWEAYNQYSTQKMLIPFVKSDVANASISVKTENGDRVMLENTWE